MTIRTIPEEWLDDGRPDRIVVHWTGGSWRANRDDRQAYHLLIEGTAGNLVRGAYPVRANDSTRDRDGYAAHVRNANTRSIGIALCGMGGSVERPFRPGAYPLSRGQWSTLYQLCADLCRHYRIPVRGDTVLTHAEVESAEDLPLIATRPDWAAYGAAQQVQRAAGLRGADVDGDLGTQSWTALGHALARGLGYVLPTDGADG
jgi:hypothetical protein